MCLKAKLTAVRDREGDFAGVLCKGNVADEIFSLEQEMKITKKEREILMGIFNGCPSLRKAPNRVMHGMTASIADMRCTAAATATIKRFTPMTRTLSTGAGAISKSSFTTTPLPTASQSNPQLRGDIQYLDALLISIDADTGLN